MAAQGYSCFKARIIAVWEDRVSRWQRKATLAVCHSQSSSQLLGWDQVVPRVPWL